MSTAGAQDTKKGKASLVTFDSQSFPLLAVVCGGTGPDPRDGKRSRAHPCCLSLLTIPLSYTLR